jgi:type IV pilus assembly protein PilF
MRTAAAALAVLALAGCVAQTTTETRSVQDAQAIDARRRAEIRTNLAVEYYQRGNMVVALEEARNSIKADPTYTAAYNVQGLVFMELREDAQARQSFETALRYTPNDPEILNNYGWFLCLRGDHPRAMELFTRAQADPLYATPEKPLLNAGLCSRREGKTREAEEYLRRAVLIRPDLVGALLTLAEISFEKGILRDSEIYVSRYTRLVGEPNLNALVLGVKLARAMGDRAAEDSMQQQLRRRFPDAPQTRELLEAKR